MKTTSSPLALPFFIFFFVVALFAFSGAEYVRDTDGHLVPLGGTYYLKAQEIEGAAVAGVTITNPDGSCSLGVVELLNNNGNPVRLNSPLRSTYITTEQALEISFNPLPANTCTKHPEWIVVEDIDFEHVAVMAGDPSEYDYPISGWFQIRTYNANKHYYTLIFCTGQYNCGLVGLKNDREGNTRLVYNTDPLAKPFVVKLVKSTSDNVATNISMVL